MTYRTINALDAKCKRVLLRADLNVPVRDGRITDRTRIERLTPTIRELAEKGARVIVTSHFDRPKGKRLAEGRSRHHRAIGHVAHRVAIAGGVTPLRRLIAVGKTWE